MAFNDGIKVFFGGDTTGLRNSIHDAESQADAFTRGMGRKGRELRELFHLGAGFALGLGLKEGLKLFSEAIDSAQKLRDKLEESGGIIDEDTKSLAQFGDQLDVIKEASVSAAGAVLNVFTQAGEQIGEWINQMRGFSVEEQDAMDASDAAAAKAIKNLAKIAEAKEKAYKADHDPAKLAEQEKKLGDIQLKNEMASMNAEEKLKVLQAEQLKTAKELLATGTDTVKGKEKAIELEQISGEVQKAKIAAMERQNEIFDNAEAEIIAEEQVQAALQKQIADDAEREAEAKQAASDAAAKQSEGNQKGTEAGLGGILGMQLAGSDQLQNATDADLKAYIQRQLNNAEQFSNPALNEGMASGNSSKLTNRLNAASFTAAAEQARQELERRNKLQSDINFGGTDYARQNYQGNILNFDKMVSQLETGVTKTDRTNQLLEKMNNTLDKSLKNG